MAQKVCVSIGPYGEDESQQSFRKDLEVVLKSVFDGSGYLYTPYWERTKTDMQSEVYTMLVEADLVVADLRGLNPNVMYEVGIRHSFNKPIVHLRDANTKLPWDIDKNFVLTYPLSIQASHIDKLVEQIKDHVGIIAGLDNRSGFSSFYNTVMRSAQIEGLDQDLDTKDVLKSLLNGIEQIKAEQRLHFDDGIPERLRIVKMLREAGHSQAEIAEKVGISQPRVSQLVKELKETYGIEIQTPS